MVTNGEKSWDFGRPRAGFVWPSETPRARLLLQHGYGEYAGRYVGHYHQLIPQLNRIGFDVYAFDLEGHGHSGGERGVADIRVSVEDHLTARKALKGDLPLFLFGHSLGGLVTAVSAARDSEGISGVILSAPALKIEISPALKLIARLLSAVAPAARATPPIPPESLSRIPEEVRAYEDDPLICLKAPPARLGATALSISEEGWRRYADWHLPVLILHGAKDEAATVKGSEDFFSLISAKDGQMEIFPDGYHELLNDLDRERALNLILDWLQNRLP